MTDSGLPPEVVGFLDAHIFSVTQLEVLLLAREQAAPDGCTAGELSRIAHVPEPSLTPWLEAFVAGGLLTRDGARFGAAPLEGELADTLVTVSDCYARRRVTLSRHVYSSGDPVRRFADAFRFRKDKDHR